IENLTRTGLIPLLTRRVIDDGVPVLGICLGMHLMTKGSAEGRRSGLGWIDAETIRFEPKDEQLKVPHMGWNRVTRMRASPLTEDLPPDPRFYFVHSYFVRCREPHDVLLTTKYGETFHSGF